MTENIKTTGYVLMLLGVWSWVQDMEYTEKHAQEAEYTRALERTLATCLSGPDQTLIIENEVWLCGVSKTGIKL